MARSARFNHGRTPAGRGRGRRLLRKTLMSGVLAVRQWQSYGGDAARRPPLWNSSSGWRAFAVALALVLGSASAAAQTFHGTFTTMGNAGPISLTLERNGSALSGSIEGNGNSFRLSGEVLTDDPTISFGTVEAPGGTLIFEAYLAESVLELFLFTPLANGEVELESVTVFESAGHPSPAVAAAEVTPAPGNPLAGARAADAFAGRYSDGSLTLELRASAGGYEGTITVGGSAYPLTARSGDSGIKGNFSAGAGSYPFSFRPEGSGFILESDGASYRLSAMGNPLASAATEADNEPQGNAEGVRTSEVLATGPYGTFTRDAALAYIEALEFSLQQVGRSGVLAGSGQEQIIDALAANYSMLEPESQMAMSNARQIWTETHAGWSIASPLEQQEFVLAVLTIAYGEQAARAALGLRSTTDTNAAGGDYLGIPSVDPQVQEDTFNTQGCSAAAGCNGYDPIGNDFSFDTPGDY